MFRKINNKTLLIIFAILAVVVVAVYFYDQKTGERTFKSELFTVDSAAVTSITIYAKGTTGEFLKLNKTGNGWEIQSKNKKYPADTSTIRNFIHSLVKITPERVAGTDRSSWKEYEITDSLCSRVVVEQGDEVAADFRTGKVSFSQNKSRQNYGNYGMEVKSHVRVSGDDRVYVVDGFLSMMFADDVSRYRNKMVVKLDKKDITRISFIYPGDSSFMLVREGQKWFLNDKPADSTLTEQWLNSLAYLTNSEFADEEAQPFTYPFNLRIEGNNMNVIDVSGAEDTAAKKYFVKSTFNPSAVFVGSAASLFDKVFPGKDKFLADKKPGQKEKK